MKFFIKYAAIAAALLVYLMPSNIFAKSLVKVHVSILPQKYFVEQIGRDNVKVDVLVKPGKSPSTYSPSPDQIRNLASSDVYFRIGVPFENGILNKIESIANARIVDTRKGIALRTVEKHYHGKAAHTHDSVHQNVKNAIGKDPHIWMNPLMVKKQAHTIFQTLSNIDPDHRNIYKTNYDLFSLELDALDKRLKTILKPLKGQNLFVFHPSFGYFTDAYGLKQVAIETMGKAPKGKELSNIIKLAKKQKARIIFVQAQFDRNAAEKIASAIKGTVVSIDPLAYDYPSNMENIAQTIIRALKKQTNETE
ncbi:metal ABC transporter solute-binding protein, Zn/Mn family [Desulfobacula toluolica]|uniref:Periplasmic solute-binding protein n=1 Tax=Desulfobacula toluolica (strain DSM 7467 / Tol2) TaxID=651182 RepID=K0NE16_DESTT|nr:zinc ABC transporter substrate-binding protein [Desulfobacula toluolica]CCK79211.1 periplasmic solute-binding protein [Desulfobacula toluolica Tol2]